MVHRALGPAHRFLDCLLGGGHYRSQAHPTRLDQLPLGGPTLSSTVANWRKLLMVIAVAAMVVVLGALPALAQPTTLTATGVLGQPFFEGQDPEPLYPLTDEATGTIY